MKFSVMFHLQFISHKQVFCVSKFNLPAVQVGNAKDSFEFPTWTAGRLIAIKSFFLFDYTFLFWNKWQKLFGYGFFCDLKIFLYFFGLIPFLFLIDYYKHPCLDFKFFALSKSTYNLTTSNSCDEYYEKDYLLLQIFLCVARLPTKNAFLQ